MKVPAPGNTQSDLGTRIYDVSTGAVNSIPSTLLSNFDPRQPSASINTAKKIISAQLTQASNTLKTDITNKAISNAKTAVSDILTGNSSKAVGDLLGKSTGSAISQTSSARNQKSVYERMRNRHDPLLAIDWDIILPPILASDGSSLQLPGIYVEDLQINLSNFTTDPIAVNGTYLYFPKQSDTGVLTMTLYENILLDATSYLVGWQNRVQDPSTGYYNYPVNYKNNITIQILAPGGVGKDFLTVGQYTVIGCFPSDRGGLDLMSESSERKKITCTMSVDGVVFKPIPITIPSDNKSQPLSTASATLSDRLIKGGLSFLKSLTAGPNNNKPNYAGGNASSLLSNMA